MDPRFRTPGRRGGLTPKLPPLQLGVRLFEEAGAALRVRSVRLPHRTHRGLKHPRIETLPGLALSGEVCGEVRNRRT
jgi:hypothetical protein